MDDIRTKTVTIGAGASLSDAATLLPNDGRLCAIVTASTWDTQAVTFQGSVDGTNYFNIYKEATEYSMAGVTASTWRAIDMSAFYGVRYLKVRSGTAAVPANQVDATIVTLVLWQV